MLYGCFSVWPGSCVGQLECQEVCALEGGAKQSMGGGRSEYGRPRPLPGNAVARVVLCLRAVHQGVGSHGEAAAPKEGARWLRSPEEVLDHQKGVRQLSSTKRLQFQNKS